MRRSPETIAREFEMPLYVIDLPPIRHPDASQSGPTTVTARVANGDVCIWRGAWNADRAMMTYSIAIHAPKLASDVRPYAGPSRWREVAAAIRADRKQRKGKR